MFDSSPDRFRIRFDKRGIIEAALVYCARAMLGNLRAVYRQSYAYLIVELVSVSAGSRNRWRNSEPKRLRDGARDGDEIAGRIAASAGHQTKQPAGGRDGKRSGRVSGRVDPGDRRGRRSFVVLYRK